MFISLAYLPFIIIKPQKFAGAFTLASLFFLSALAALRGPLNFFKSLMSKEKRLFSFFYNICCIGSLYYSIINPVYILALIFSIA
jgi:hypothetical protein